MLECQTILHKDGSQPSLDRLQMLVRRNSDKKTEHQWEWPVYSCDPTAGEIDRERRKQTENEGLCLEEPEDQLCQTGLPLNDKCHQVHGYEGSAVRRVSITTG